MFQTLYRSSNLYYEIHLIKIGWNKLNLRSHGQNLGSSGFTETRPAVRLNYTCSFVQMETENSVHDHNWQIPPQLFKMDS